MLLESRYTNKYNIDIFQQTNPDQIFKCTSIPPRYVKNIMDILKIGARSTHETEQLRAEIEKIVRFLSFSMASERFWRFLQQVFQGRGFFEYSYPFQEFASEMLKYELECRRSPILLLQLIRQNIYDLNLKDADNNLKKLKLIYPITVIFLRDDYRLLRSYVSLCLDGGGLISLRRSNSRRKFDAWKKYISNKELLIIGRGPEAEQKVISDMNSRVIRIYTKNVNWLYNKEKYISPDIIYSNSFHSLHLMSLIKSDDLIKSRWIITKGVTKISRYKKMSRSMQLIDSLYLHGTAFMIPLILMDILQVETKHIHVTGTTFYASRQKYEGETNLFKRGTQAVNEIDKIKSDFCLSLSAHGLVENKNIVKNLYLSNIISFDQLGEEIMSISDVEYLRLLDKVIIFDE